MQALRPRRPPRHRPIRLHALLTTSGYIINRERIEFSPRFVGIVRWIGVKKGDPVKKGQVVVLLDDSEQRARLAEAEGRLARAQAAVAIAKTRFNRLKTLREQRVESEQQLDDSLAELNAAEAGRKGSTRFAGTLQDGNWSGQSFARRSMVSFSKSSPTKMNWSRRKALEATKAPAPHCSPWQTRKTCKSRSILTRRTFRKSGSTQPCRVAPEAYPEHVYDGYVAEIAPEANRQKGTLQVKVQVKNPDRYLVPELSAKVDFLASSPPVSP